MSGGSLDYANARIHARLGRRPDEATWRSLGQARELDTMLDLVAATTLGGIARPLAAAPDLHALDRLAEGAWRCAVGELSRWMPAAFARAIDWCAPLPLLPALAFLARGEPVPAWLAQHPRLAPLAAAAPPARGALLAECGLAPLEAAWRQPSMLGGSWLAEWERRLPGSVARTGPLAELARLVSGFLAGVADALPHEAAPMREAFEHGLLQRLRRHAPEPASAFAWLGLTALDIRRLRGEFARRIAMPGARLVP